MKSIVVLILGFCIGFLYVVLIVFFQANDSKKSNFLYHKKNNKINIYSRLSQKDKNSSIIKHIQKICYEQECKKNISFDKDINSPKWIGLLDKLILFVDDKNISDATLLTDKNGYLEINFLLKNKDDLKSLKNICQGYKNIKNTSSVIEVFDISNIEKSINTILNKSNLKFDLSKPDTNTQKVLKKVFRKLKELGKTDIAFFVNISDDEIKNLKSYIQQNFNWIEKIEFIKDKKNKIKIKEVLS